MASRYFIKANLTQTMRHAQQKRMARKMWDSLVNSVGQVCNQQKWFPERWRFVLRKRMIQLNPTNPISAENFSFRPPRFGGQKFRETWKRKGVELLVVLEGCG